MTSVGKELVVSAATQWNVSTGRTTNMKYGNGVRMWLNGKVSDRSQPSTTFDFSSGLNGWLQFAAPSCWLQEWTGEAQRNWLDSCALAHPKATLHNPDI